MKMVRLLLLLAVLFGVAAMIYVMVMRPADSGGSGAELRSGQPRGERGVRVEEKYGVTSEQAGP